MTQNVLLIYDKYFLYCNYMLTNEQHVLLVKGLQVSNTNYHDYDLRLSELISWNHEEGL